MGIFLLNISYSTSSHMSEILNLIDAKLTVSDKSDGFLNLT